jgi:NAD(P)-dependent dehydrogenase (short-subunit alcohol dehydrogenase family)
VRRPAAKHTGLTVTPLFALFTLRGSQILVNAACPGYVKTDLNGNSGYPSLPEAAAIPVRLALLRRDRPAGKFLSTDAQVPW